MFHKPGMTKMTKSIPIAIDFIEGSVSVYLDSLCPKKSFIVAKACGQCYKTFYSRNLQIFVES
jgi:hypothetical protein